MTSTLNAPPLPQPDLHAVKLRQQQTWASGDFAVVAARIVLVAEQLCDCGPGGTIALASWTPQGFIGELFQTVGAHVAPPAGVPAPMLWGTESHLRDLFGGGIRSLEVTERTFTFRFRSAEEFVAFFRRWYGPTLKAFAALEGDARDALEPDLVELARRFDRLGLDALASPPAYTEAVTGR